MLGKDFLGNQKSDDKPENNSKLALLTDSDHAIVHETIIAVGLMR